MYLMPASSAARYPSVDTVDHGDILIIIPRKLVLINTYYFPTNPTSACLAQRAATMASSPPVESDPFADPGIVGEQQEFARESILTVGRNASLTLATDSLIVLGTPTPSPVLCQVDRLTLHRRRAYREADQKLLWFGTEQ